MTNHCCRCASPATAVMSFEYATARIWLDDAGDDVAPGAGYAMCERHAGAMNGPVGWTVDDRRSPMRRLFAVDVA